MKVWELIARLSELPAGHDVFVGIGPTLNVAASDFYAENSAAVIRSDSDVEVSMCSGDISMLNDLSDDTKED